MSTEIRIEIPGLVKTRAEIERRASLVRRAMIEGLRLSSEAVKGETQQRLTGPVLNVRTGRLRQSIHYLLNEGPRPRSIIGTNVEYGKVHEYGLTIQHPGSRAVDRPSASNPARRHTLAFMVGGQMIYRLSTRPHQIKFPERSFLRSSLGESTPLIRRIMVDKLSAAVGGAS